MTVNTKKVWFITGASSGFGRCLVTEVLGRGDRVIATSRSWKSLEVLEGTNENLRVLQLDVTGGPDIIRAKMAEAAAFFGGLDVIVNNAGVNYLGMLEEGGSPYLRKQFDVCLFGVRFLNPGAKNVMDVTTAALPYLRAQKDGTVIIIGSRSAWIPEFPVSPRLYSSSYASAKAALHALAEAFSGELAHLNIRVLLVEPSAFRTGMASAEGFMDGLERKDRIPDYDLPRNKTLDLFKAVRSQPGSVPGDPVKAMAAVVDVVRGEGVAVGRPWPTYLVLGKDAEKAILAKTEKLKNHLEEWTDVVRGVDFETVNVT
ncbi:hypothetical protein C8F04DRAFT_1073533 [Mycena alexandri]|uniref:Uncharacterized protein n=1 Tax=Mycena alexandri TaxID=1745969 RepID=A0AAD6XF75_9AGAR|nr:hypothetical protein C8F04DRAFT_1073533 [Mycena alexandri]